MASGTETPLPREAEGQPQAPPTQREAFIEGRIRQTRRQVKAVDIAGGLLILTIGTLAYLLAGAVIDHWVFFGGLGFWGRFVLFAGLIGGAGWYIARRVLPLLRRINPVFAAHTIEQGRPTLKNSLVNFLFLRRQRRDVSPVIYRALEDRAAADLSRVPAELAVDRTQVIRLGYVLVATFAVCCLYLVLSPKSPLVSAVRIVWPWADKAAPTRVTIKEIEPGDTSTFYGEHLIVSAEVDGLKDDEPLWLYYTTADGQIVDEAIPMTLDDGYRHRCKLPPQQRGLQQDLQYYLQAGDCTTKRFAVDVQIAPAIVVDRIDYDYPAYAEIADRTVEHQGDVRALEGTKVTIRATANQPIRSASIDLNCNGRRELRMHAEGRKATGRLTLRLSEDNPTRGEYDCYQLRFVDQSGRLNRRPIRHRIEVIRDLPPEVELIEPRQEEVQLPEDGQMEIRVRAEDPDYALRRVVLRAEREGLELAIPPMLDGPHQGEFQEGYLFQPERLTLKAGDRVFYWAEAEDNKQPTPGRSETAQRWITIVGPESPEAPEQNPQTQQSSPQQDPQPNPSQPPDQQPDADQPPQESQPPQPSDQPQSGEQQPPEADSQQPEEAPDPNQPGQQDDAAQSPDGTEGPESGSADPTGDQPADEPRAPIDPKTQDGDAFEEILDEMNQQRQNEDGGQQGDQQQGDQQQGDQQQGDQQQSPQQQGDRQQTGKQQDDQQQGSQQQPGGQQGDQQQSPQRQPGGQQGDQQQTGGQQGDQQQTGKQQGSQQQPGGQQGNQQQSPQQQGDQQQGDRQQTSGQQGGKQQSAQQQTDSQQTQQGDSQEGGKQETPGAGEPSDGQTASPSPQETNQPRDKQPGATHDQQPSRDQESPDSPSISPKQSDSESDSQGDRSGGGGKGGGQRAERPGKGTSGSQTEAQDGGSPASQQGDGETGDRGGNRVQSDRPTGSPAAEEGGPGSSGRRQSANTKPGGQQPGDEPQPADGTSAGGTPQANPSDGGRPGERTSDGPSARGDGNPAGGGQPGERHDVASPPESREPGADDPNLQYAQKATDLALEYLDDQAKQEESELLDRLGWTPQEARQFVEKWEKMKRAAAQQGAEGKAARQSLEEALLSLGLRPQGTQLRGGATGPDQVQDMREAGTPSAPAQWSEWLRAYTRGAAGGR